MVAGIWRFGCFCISLRLWELQCSAAWRRKIPCENLSYTVRTTENRRKFPDLRHLLSQLYRSRLIRLSGRVSD